MKKLPKKDSPQEQLKRILAVFPDEEEAKAILEYDTLIEESKAKDKQEFDLDEEREKVSKLYRGTGTRMITNLSTKPRERKPNATKSGIVAELAKFLTENSDFSVENVKIVNKERQISFDIGTESFELTLVQKRKPKK